MASKRPLTHHECCSPIIGSSANTLKYASRKKDWMASLEAVLILLCNCIKCYSALHQIQGCSVFPPPHLNLLFTSYAFPADVVGVYDPMEIDTVVRHIVEAP